MSDQPRAASDPAQQPVEFSLNRLPNLRRVVTGHDETGKAILSMDDAVEIKVDEATLVFKDGFTDNKIFH